MSCGKQKGKVVQLRWLNHLVATAYGGKSERKGHFEAPGVDQRGVAGGRAVGRAPFLKNGDRS
jgi:hypothetical protein